VADAQDLFVGKPCQPFTSILRMGITQPGFRSTKSGSGSPIVAMVQPSQSWLTHHPTGSRAGNSAERCLLGKAKMRAAFVVVADVFSEQPFQVAFINRDDVVQ